MKIVFFESPDKFRKWLEKNHATADELWVGFYKKASGKPSITWPESVDQALCFGWIDGLRKNIDEISYKIRFSPRKPQSIWSSVNIKRAKELIAAGLMKPAGEQAFQSRQENKSGVYSYEQRRDKLDEPYEKKLRQNKAAWNFFYAQSPSYRRAVFWWIVSAKKEETRIKRLDQLIELSAKGELIPQFL